METKTTEKPTYDNVRTFEDHLTEKTYCRLVIFRDEVLRGRINFDGTLTEIAYGEGEATYVFQGDAWVDDRWGDSKLVDVRYRFTLPERGQEPLGPIVVERIYGGPWNANEWKGCGYLVGGGVLQMFMDGGRRMIPEADTRDRGICEDHEILDRYDPDASAVIATECPGCGGVIVVFPKGTVAQPRTEPIPAGEMPAGLLDSAFEKHFCPARPGLFACVHCGDRYDAAEAADRCCSGPYNDYGFVRVLGAAPIEDGDDDDE